MCRGTEWEHEAWRPFSGFAHDLLPGRAARTKDKQTERL
jgi:hypothetical protein